MSEDSEILTADEDVGRRVAADPFGIGVTNFAGRGNARSLDVEDVCGLTSAPSDFNIKSEDYPLTRRLFAYRSNVRQGPYVDEMLQFIAAAKSQPAIGGAGFADQRIQRLALRNQGARFATALAQATSQQELVAIQNLATTVGASDRLSTTFRFDGESEDLDVRGRQNLRRLAAFLANPAANVDRVQLLGFTGSVGDATANVTASTRAAETIRDALIEIEPSLADTIELRADGFGEIAPVACNDTAEGRWINRRVEVWLPEPGR